MTSRDMPSTPAAAASAPMAPEAPVASISPAPPASLSERLLRGDLLAADCPSRDVLKHVTSRWGVLVLITLEQRMHRFSELKRTIGGVSERMLAQTLQWLEADGLVQRKAYQVVPPHVEYRLTPLGRECAEKVRLLADWIELNLPRIQAASGEAG